MVIMKYVKYTLLLSVLMFAACSSNTPKNETAESIAPTTDSAAIAADANLSVYQCPMKCQGDTTYTVAGQCPVCGMDLEKL